MTRAPVSRDFAGNLVTFQKLKNEDALDVSQPAQIN